MSTPTDTERFADLESRLAFQEDALQSLNDALVRSQNRIDTLEATIQALVERLSETPWNDDFRDDGPPPHY